MILKNNIEVDSRKLTPFVNYKSGNQLTISVDTGFIVSPSLWITIRIATCYSGSIEYLHFCSAFLNLCILLCKSKLNQIFGDHDIRSKPAPNDVSKFSHVTEEKM